ncbi:TonB-dependent receptor plug domain-containing protein [Parabacteroides bouchesdurhonensis]|uniref:TonB-dependent receptor plug domain-containing protein n=1 Tax=Parabacteroides bouchesdurhonensis TaxID=1936995 RepID=UPI000E4F81AE|nr:TonB-dependent receptor [Parabacteroides bouchesdurhonensis]RHJ95153.1 TonB-dependent receptor [Bacteroides sp. AM07-16]
MKKELLLCSGLLSVVASYATDIEKIDSLVNLHGVVVTANRIQVNRNSVPLSISVINRAEIEASSESALLPVLSQKVPGLFVTQKGITGFGVSTGSAGAVNIRGVGSGNKVLMLFDGQPQWAGVFGHALPDTYVASDVERVEVIRGPGSLIYGSNAMGGVVNIITRQHTQEGRRTQARVMFGSYNTQKYMVNNGYNVGNFSSFISINHDRTDGHRPNSEFHITNGFVNLGYKIDKHYNVSGNLSLAKFKNHNPGEINAPKRDNVMDILRGTTSLGIENHYDKVSGAFRVFYNWGDHDINDGYREGATPSPFIFRSDDHNTGIQFYQSFRLVEGNSFTAGVDYKNWGGHAWNDSIKGPHGEVVDKTVNEVAGYVIMQQDLFDKLSLNAGVRYEHSSAYGNQWIPQAGFALRLFEGNTIKGSFSKGFRSPTLRELYISYLPYSKANPDLLPESMLNYELSVGQSFLDNRLTAELTAFYIDGKNMISAVSGQLQNIGRFYNKGIEVEARYQILSNLGFDANYSYLYTNQPIEAAPSNKFYAGATYSPGRFTFNLNVQSISGLYIRVDNKDASNNLKENYTLLNARAAYRFGTEQKGLNLFVKGENLTAARYQINFGYPMPKAVFMGGVEVTF